MDLRPVGAHIEVNFIEVAVWLEHNIHIIQASDLEVSSDTDWIKGVLGHSHSCAHGNGGVT